MNESQPAPMHQHRCESGGHSLTTRPSLLTWHWSLQVCRSAPPSWWSNHVQPSRQLRQPKLVQASSARSPSCRRAIKSHLQGSMFSTTCQRRTSLDTYQTATAVTAVDGQPNSQHRERSIPADRGLNTRPGCCWPTGVPRWEDSRDPLMAYDLVSFSNISAFEDTNICNYAQYREVP
ncbi:hypothetical protein CALCODRAFT_361356 [Calocera cornea HHB12733]|uniref:Uncharacterized protein n=1 Tax=Calocera cornea HHB12733 TaxID=1353952 RepID=A0A165EL28_9BASI|nr:hypothetical protein CALCODRAFT_361356 [Calocera cornea HHB12733]